jgi:branched-chain amino acid transport system ATP-binding protein
MIAVRAIACGYGRTVVVRDVSFSAAAGEVLCVLGRNGAGKTTLLKAIMGLLPLRAGHIEIDREDVTGLPAHDIARRGVAYVPQGRRLFAELTVRENIEIGLMTRGAGKPALDRVLTLFPALAERLRQTSGTLSGGEQQMLAMARALATEPKVVLLDEPTEGLMPAMIARIRDAIAGLKAAGVATILVEQRVGAVLAVADRVAFMETGRLKGESPAAALRENAGLLERYIGVGVKDAAKA